MNLTGLNRQILRHRLCNSHSIFLAAMLHLLLPSSQYEIQLRCLSSIYAWFCFNELAINSEVVLFGSCQRLHSIPLLSSIDHACTAGPLSDAVKILGLTNPGQ